QNAVLAGPPEARKALLVDLGLAGAERAARGSLEYAAPEVLEGAPPDATADLYSLGVTLHELLGGANPFAAATPVEVVRAHFEAAARRAADGTGAHLLLVGPSGSGRSRLLREFRVAAELAGLRTLHLEQGAGLATLCRWLGILLGLGPSSEPTVGAARERLFA